MCGIVGVANLRASLPSPGRPLVARMVAALRHRGPDEFGLYLDDRVGLGHARLSIVDLAAGQQPMETPDGGLVVAFNGEIFNHVELREELTAKGHSFRTRSDTEVILHAWRAWGEACLDRFNGQWAFALWDARACELTLARDRLGVRPIHLHEGGGRVRFASEVKALETRLDGREYALGGRFSAVDVMLGDMGAWARAGKFKVESDRVNAYFDRVLGRPARARSQANGGSF